MTHFNSVNMSVNTPLVKNDEMLFLLLALRVNMLLHFCWDVLLDAIPAIDKKDFLIEFHIFSIKHGLAHDINWHF